MARGAGDTAEQLAAVWLRKQGFELLEQNLQCRFGEIDLVMRKADILALVEVKYRAAGLDAAALSVTAAKQRRLSQAAQWFFTRRPLWQGLQCRFDVLCVAGELARPEFKWLPAAFELQA